VANKAVGDLILLLQETEGENASCESLIEGFCRKNQVPGDLTEELAPDDDRNVIIRKLKVYVANCTDDIELLIEQSAEAAKNLRYVSKIWSEIRTGLKMNETLPVGVASFYQQVHEYLVALRAKHSAETYRAYSDPQRNSSVDGEEDDPSSSDDDEPNPRPSNLKPTGKAGSYSDATKAASSKSTSEPPTERWADYDSTDDEEQDFSSLLKSFGKSGIESKPFIEVPKDFEDIFPGVAKAWRKMAEKWQWEVRNSDCSFHTEGFIANEFGKASEEERVRILSALRDTERIALNTLVSFMYSVLYRPEAIASGEQANLVSGYVTSLFLKEHYKKSESEASLLSISLKGGDAGENLIRVRVMSCFKTGSKCANVLINTVNKMLRKIIGKASKDELQSVLKCSGFCFTSPLGMMQNCYRTTSKRVVVEEDSTDKRGKSKKSRKTVMKLGKDKPHLSAKTLELSQKEFELVHAKENSFNKMDEIALQILEEVQEPDDPLMTAKVMRFVVDLAYNKISGIRHLNKERRNTIRAKAQELAGPGKSLTSSDWMKAKKEVISSFEEIKSETLACLEWDIAGIIKSIGLTKSN
jgi:hypothetical protein